MGQQQNNNRESNSRHNQVNSVINGQSQRINNQASLIQGLSNQAFTNQGYNNNNQRNPTGSTAYDNYANYGNYNYCRSRYKAS